MRAIRVPGPGRLGERLAMRVGALQAAEVRALAHADAGDEEAHVLLLCLHDTSNEKRDDSMVSFMTGRTPARLRYFPRGSHEINQRDRVGVPGGLRRARWSISNRPEYRRQRLARRYPDRLIGGLRLRESDTGMPPIP